MNVPTKVTEIIGRAADVAARDLRPETQLSDLGMGSLEKIECVLSLEETFRVEIAEDDLWRIRTVQDAIELVQRSVGAQN
jgi:acyl carrier protein